MNGRSRITSMNASVAPETIRTCERRLSAKRAPNASAIASASTLAASVKDSPSAKTGQYCATERKSSVIARHPNLAAFMRSSCEATRGARS